MSTATSTARRPHPVRRAGTPAPSGDLRLTRRGRLVVVCAFLTLLLGVLLSLGGYSAASDASSPASTRTVVVEEGDTMWGIASRTADGRDVREVVHELEELNALSGPELVEGQRILVPVG